MNTSEVAKKIWDLHQKLLKEKEAESTTKKAFATTSKKVTAGKANDKSNFPDAYAY
jgi:hypothetical protein